MKCAKFLVIALTAQPYGQSAAAPFGVHERAAAPRLREKSKTAPGVAKAAKEEEVETDRPASSSSSSSSSSSAAPSLARGGAGRRPLDRRAAVAGAYAALGFVHGGLFAVAPARTASALYGVDRTCPVQDFLAVRSGTAECASAALWWLRSERGMSAARSAGAVAVPLAALSLQDALSGRPAELGYPAGLELFNFAFFSFVAHSGLTETYATCSILTLAEWALFNGLLLFVDPRLFGKVYGTPEREAPVLVSRRMFGLDLASFSILLGSLAFGQDPTRALGFHALLNGLGIAFMTFIKKDFENIGLPNAPMYLWIVIMSIVAGTLIP